MNPKEQSRLDLMLRFRDVDVPRAAFWDNPTVAEINRRLVEADALRKENEELHKALDYVTSFISIEDVGDEVVSPGVVVSSERLEEHATINGVLGFNKCEHPFAQPVIDVLMRAAKAAESKDSHA